MVTNQHLTEEELINGCLIGNRKSQEILYLRYSSAMFNLALRITNDHGHAEDALQEAFLDVFIHIKQFKGNSTLGAWIKRIVIRKSLKSQKGQTKTSDITHEMKEEILSWPLHSNGDDLEKAIHELPNGYRHIFVLAVIEGFTHEEIGNLLGIAPGTSKSQLHNAKKALKISLHAYNPTS